MQKLVPDEPSADSKLRKKCVKPLGAGRIQVKRRNILLWGIAGVAVAATATTLWLRLHHWKPAFLTIQGAVIRSDTDTRNQLPIAGAQVTASDGTTSASTESDASGYFKITLPGVIWPGRIVDLSFSRA